MKKLFLFSVLLLSACTTPTPAPPVEVFNAADFDINTATLEVPYASYFNDINPWIIIQFYEYEPIVLELFPAVAPITVDHITSLVARGFYEDIIFHRVIESFVIQGGDPTGTGTGGSGTNIKGEFIENGVPNRLRHWRGVLSMARGPQDFNSASSQFFIVHEDSRFLDGIYASFGGVIQGFETLDAIATVATDENARPLEEVVIKSIRLINR
jgi:peptidyl-prolyl cis-trans isomerase B (cyclophilin B)